MSCVKPQTLLPITDRAAWQRRRAVRQRVLAGVRQRRARKQRPQSIRGRGAKEER